MLIVSTVDTATVDLDDLGESPFSRPFSCSYRSHSDQVYTLLSGMSNGGVIPIFAARNARLYRNSPTDEFGRKRVVCCQRSVAVRLTIGRIVCDDKTDSALTIGVCGSRERSRRIDTDPERS